MYPGFRLSHGVGCLWPHDDPVDCLEQVTQECTGASLQGPQHWLVGEKLHRCLHSLQVVERVLCHPVVAGCDSHPGIIGPLADSFQVPGALGQKEEGVPLTEPDDLEHVFQTLLRHQLSKEISHVDHKDPARSTHLCWFHKPLRPEPDGIRICRIPRQDVGVLQVHGLEPALGQPPPVAVPASIEAAGEWIPGIVNVAYGLNCLSVQLSSSFPAPHRCSFQTQS